MMYSALRCENCIARSSVTGASASTVGAGNAWTVTPSNSTGVPYRRTRRARVAKAKARFTCWALIAPTSISNGSGTSVGRRPKSAPDTRTSGASTGSAAAAA